jgi:Tol biopolymer transport system component
VFGIGAFFDRPAKPGQLALIRPDGTGFRTLTDGKASAGFASWSPDGNRLVYRVMGNGEYGLRILTVDDGKVTVLTNEYDISGVVATWRSYRARQLQNRRLRHLHHSTGRLRGPAVDGRPWK